MDVRLNCTFGCVHATIYLSAKSLAGMFTLISTWESTFASLVHFYKVHVLLQEPVSPNDHAAAHNISNFKAELTVSTNNVTLTY